MPYADLHVHSNNSDGTLSCEEIVEHALRHESVRAIAVADHDSLDGADRGQAACRGTSITCIPAVEVSTQTDGRNVHMLAYFIDTQSSSLNELFEKSRTNRYERTLKIAENLREAGYPVSADELLACGQTVNRPLLARKLIERGYAKTVDECFSTLIGKNSPYYVEVQYPNSIEVIHLIRESGGFAFVAHPAHYRVVDLITQFAKEGLTGLEAYHTMQTHRQSAELVELAGELGIAISGGSDWHGDATHGAELGSAGLEKPAFNAFLRACERA